jgi:mannose-6-phosphate isomerase-like protein (cupin superfamily)
LIAKYEVEDIFPEPLDLGDRNWGSESLIALVSEMFSVKRLKMNAGSKGGLQYHRFKNEVAVLLSGSLVVRYDLGDGCLREKVCGPGDVVHFPPGFVHQEEALSDCELIEVSSPYFNDRVRVEHMYGIDSNGGLPSTKETEIEFR